MKAPAEKSPDTQRQAAAHEASPQRDHSDAALQFVDNRAKTADLRQMQKVTDNSSRMQGLAQLKALMNGSLRSTPLQNLQVMVDNSPRQVAQREQYRQVQGVSQTGSRNVLVQRVEEEKLLQNKLVSEMLAQQVERKPNNTGLPDKLKTGIENLSGMSMDNVKVHYNSPQPAQLNALAYAQGTDIHVAPGQEQHLPHEAWHVVQQAQGRVQPTMQMKGGALINDDQGLEREAGLMSGKALNVHVNWRAEQKACASHSGRQVSQLARQTVNGQGQTKHTIWGDAYLNKEVGAINQNPMIIEVMEYQTQSALNKIQQIGATKPGVGTDYRAIMIACNGKANVGDYDGVSGDFKNTADLSTYNAITNSSTRLQTELVTQGLNGGVIPIVWSPTDPAGGQDTYSQFPFLEMRARIPLHAGTATLHDHIKERAGDKEVIGRSMDADVSDDPLLDDSLSRKIKKSLFKPLLEFTGDVSSGGYNWKLTHDGAPGIWAVDTTEKENECDFKLRKCLEAINFSEHVVRWHINTLAGKALYWPEPNTYMLHSKRVEHATTLDSEAQSNKFKKSQQRESVAFLKDTTVKGAYVMPAATTKPLKSYFDNNLIAVIKNSLAGKISGSDVIDTIIANIRQSHLRPDKSADAYKWHSGENINSALFDLIKAKVNPEAASLKGRLLRILNTRYDSGGTRTAAIHFTDLFEGIHRLELALSPRRASPLETLGDILSDHYMYKEPSMLELRLDNWSKKNLNNSDFKLIRPLLITMRNRLR